jgi:alcohol dehydrogenase class IV
MPQFTFETTPKIICEQGAAKRLGEIARGLGMSQVFLVTDIGLMKAGLIDGALTSLSEAGVKFTVFSDVLADPPEVSVQTAVKAAALVQADPLFTVLVWRVDPVYPSFKCQPRRERVRK